MRVFMLGWEFPPFISGGLGTACYGLTKALSQLHTNVTFVIPKAIGTEMSSHVKLLSPQAPEAALGNRSAESVASTFQVRGAGRAAGNGGGGAVGHAGAGQGVENGEGADEFSNVTFKAVPSRITSPYPTGTSGMQPAGRAVDRPIGVLNGGPSGPDEVGEAGVPGAGRLRRAGGGWGGQQDNAHYEGDLLTETRRYADLCVDLAAGEEFDVVHAHDWMTFPAGLAVAAATGKPLVVHVHSTEFDRAGQNVNDIVYDIERRGCHGAIRVVAVSYLTSSILQHRYGVPVEKIQVVYNGIDNAEETQTAMARSAIKKGDKIVLFLGRITMQKGPEYFISAAKKVLEKVDGVKFVVAGTGDKVPEMIEQAAAHGIGHKVLFTGFLRGKDVERVFKMADLYVMPSVSEPFGIAPLEAIRHDVPVIISKTSGVSEVLTHALKVDFWDTDEIANKIIAVLKHPPLSSTLREHADIEVRGLTWEDAAKKCQSVYAYASSLMGAGS